MPRPETGSLAGHGPIGSRRTGTHRLEPRAGVVQRGRRRAACPAPRRRRGGLRAGLGGRAGRRAVGVRGAERRGPGGGPARPQGQAERRRPRWRLGRAHARHPGSAVFHRAYNGVANRTLWFVHHMLYDTPNQPNFDLAFGREWESFRAYNDAFAKALAVAADPVPAPASARSSRTITCRWPLGCWPSCAPTSESRISRTPRGRPADYYRMLPDAIGRELLDGLLGADHAGFLCRRSADAFLDCCEQFLDARVDRERQTVELPRARHRRRGAPTRRRRGRAGQARRRTGRIFAIFAVKSFSVSRNPEAEATTKKAAAWLPFVFNRRLELLRRLLVNRRLLRARRRLGLQNCSIVHGHHERLGHVRDRRPFKLEVRTHLRH